MYSLLPSIRIAHVLLGHIFLGNDGDLGEGQIRYTSIDATTRNIPTVLCTATKREKERFILFNCLSTLSACKQSIFYQPHSTLSTVPEYCCVGVLQHRWHDFSRGLDWGQIRHHKLYILCDAEAPRVLNEYCRSNRLLCHLYHMECTVHETWDTILHTSASMLTSKAIR